MRKVSDRMADDIAGRAYLLPVSGDVAERRREVRNLMRISFEQLELGVGEDRYRETFMESMWNDRRELGVDPESPRAEALMAVGARMIDACLDAARRPGD